jgi:hypothetical protein
VTNGISFRVSTFLTGSHCKLRPNTEGPAAFASKNSNVQEFLDKVMTGPEATEALKSANGGLGSYCVRPSLKEPGVVVLVRCAFFNKKMHSEDAIEFHAFAPLEALAGV